MGKTLVVVESPAKAKTIKKYLGADYEVMASKGHIMDLPKKLGVDVKHGFAETYEIVPSKEKVVAELKAAAKKAERVLLATDPDREGEAIAFHLAEVVGDKKRKTARVEFHEITRRGVEHGIANPRPLDKNLYSAQRARRVLDRIVGYDVSALVWSKLAWGLSAGRVQSVALRLIVEREEEIERFKPEEYWNIGAVLIGMKRPPFAARLVSQDGKKLAVTDGATAQRVHSDLLNAEFAVDKITAREQRRSPPAPYITSRLQQDATNSLHFTAKRTMQVAQTLYEGVDLKDDGGQVGLITYMRTDSVRVSSEAIDAVRIHIRERFGESHVPATPNVFRSKKSAQDAHEAIRPTSMELTPERVRKHLKDEQFKLYKLVWDRFVASQMTPAVYDQTSVDVSAKVKNGATVYGLRASGRILKFGGWLESYDKGIEAQGISYEAEDAAENGEGKGANGTNGTNGSNGGNGTAGGNGTKAEGETDETSGLLPELSEGEKLVLVNPPGVSAEQKFTQPPARYNEGSLVRELEKRGIGRPSTYAEIISKVQGREYAEKLAGGSFAPTQLGRMVVGGLVQSELDFMDPGFTAKMEEELDEVEAGREDRVVLLKRFYKRFRQQLDVAKKHKRWAPEPEPTEHKCEECGGVLLKRWSKNGYFLGCTNYPTCKFTRDLSNGGVPQPVRETDVVCDKCGKPMVIRTGRYGEFLACSGYPACKNSRPVPLGIACPKCGGDIIEVKPRKRGGRTFYGCSNYAAETPCDFKLWQKPVDEPCPQCSKPFLVRGGTKNKPMLVCADKECGFKKAIEPEDEEPVGFDSTPPPRLAASPQLAVES
ncbi:MAG: type I DNA topoisomerase [Deltaproteobacteria bacterium]|nr:type I DNA topoisomerase [Deltaproteobacteria bacterium]